MSNVTEKQIIRAYSMISKLPEEQISIRVAPYDETMFAAFLEVRTESNTEQKARAVESTTNGAVQGLRDLVRNMANHQIRCLNNMLGVEDPDTKRGASIEKIVSIYAALACVKESDVSVSVRKTDNADWVWIAEIHRDGSVIRAYRAKTSSDAVGGLFKEVRTFLEEEKTKLTNKIEILQKALEG